MSNNSIIGLTAAHMRLCWAEATAMRIQRGTPNGSQPGDVCKADLRVMTFTGRRKVGAVFLRYSMLQFYLDLGNMQTMSKYNLRGRAREKHACLLSQGTLDMANCILSLIMSMKPRLYTSFHDTTICNYVMSIL